MVDSAFPFLLLAFDFPQKTACCVDELPAFQLSSAIRCATVIFVTRKGAAASEH